MMLHAFSKETLLSLLQRASNYAREHHTPVEAEFDGITFEVPVWCVDDILNFHFGAPNRYVNPVSQEVNESFESFKNRLIKMSQEQGQSVWGKFFWSKWSSIELRADLDSKVIFSYTIYHGRITAN